MTTLLGLYAWTILAGGFVAIALALIGAQLSSRGQSVQALVVSQSSSLGIVVALAIGHWLTATNDHTGDHIGTLPVIGSLLMGALAAVACDRWIPARWPARNSYYISLFVVLLSGTYLITALVPSLESHMSASFFGDLAVISETDAKWMLAVALVVLSYLAWQWRSIAVLSFEIAIFGHAQSVSKRKRVEPFFLMGSIALICLSIQFMGFLFTISALFLPSILVARRSSRLRSFTAAVAAIAGAGTFVGFVVSLWHGEMPTVPAIVLSFVAFGIVSALFMGRSKAN